MKKSRASSYFFLAAVDSHIMVDVSAMNSSTIFSFSHEDDTANSSVLCMDVVKMVNGYIISYTLLNDGVYICHGNSDLIPVDKVPGVISTIVNDAFQAC